MAKHKVDRAAPEGADEAVLNLQQVDALATLKKKIEEGVEESEQAASEASAEQAPAQDAEEVSSADAALLASSDTVFTSTASHTLVAQAGGGTTGGASGLPGWVVPVTAAGVGVAAIVVASDSDSGGGGDGGGQPVNPNVQSVTPDVTTVNESGDDNSVTFTIQTDGTGGVVNFEIVGLSANDIASTNNSSSNKITGTTEVDGSGRAFVTVILAADGVTEGPESFTLSVTGTAGSDAVVSASVAVTDTSVGDPGGGDPAVEISSNAGADNAVGEGQAVTFAFDASNLPANANVQFIISGNNLVTGDIAAISGQNGPVQLSGFLTTDANGNLAPLTITVNNDNVVDGPEDLTLTLRLNGVTLATSTVDIVDSGTTVDPQTNLTITSVDVDGSDLPAARLTGDQDIRIDFTNPARQIVGLDLNGNGAIAADGRENNPANADFIAALGGADIGGYGIVDAYSRNPLNAGGNFSTRDNANNFYGDIDFDGTGFDGDGVSTDGNIFLGGFGADTALGGIGNDFLTGGGVGPLAGGGGDVLSGGRNGDFFFGEGSLLSSVDGDALFVNGGSTSDDLAAGNNSAQDSDMFLGEFSDDDEPIVVRLTGQPGSGTSSTTGEDGRIISDNGISIEIDEIEHYDASGNLYGFLDGVDVIVGGRQAFEETHTIGEQNYGIGSSAQHDILGSDANNILIGGFDNDIIDGADGNDILFGGRFDFLNNRGFVPNPNLQNIVNNGIDTLLGGDDDDSIVFEADGGTIRGDSDNRVVEAQAATGDTLYLTEYGLGRNPDDNSPVAAEDITDDGVLRFDLQAGDVAGSAQGAGIQGYRGYGGADVGFTADQSNYSAGGFRVDVTLMENFIATGLGAADYRAAGSNTPELGFNNQQNVFQYDGDLDIRGSDETNVLYSSSGDDTIEGREGDDFMSGGTGNDDFIFNLFAGDLGEGGDGVDVVHRQTNAGLNLWARDEDGNGLFEQDFNAEDGTLTTVTNLSIDFTGTAFENPPLALNTFEVTIGTERYTADLGGAVYATLQDLADTIAANLVDPDGNPDPNVSVRVEGNSIVIEDNPGEGIQGREFQADFDGYLVDPVNVNNVILLTQPTANVVQDLDQDRLIYQSYEDRFDGERTNDDTQNGSLISLGLDAYAEDLVAFFGEDGTRLAEDQIYTVAFNNLTTQDTVVITVNGVDYTLTVGRFQDGSIVAGEDTASGATQAAIQTAFLTRLAGFIQAFNDTDTAAGEVNATYVGDGATIALSQTSYIGEETVFMQEPTVEITNTSGGQPATALVTNFSEHEVFLLGFDGRNNNLNEENVLFWGDTEISRAIFETADNAGDTLVGTDAVVIDNNVSDLDSNGAATGNTPATGFTAAFVNINTNAPLSGVNNYTVHGDDQFFAGDGDDTITTGTGDDRVIVGRGMDSANGGIDLFSVRIESDPLGQFRVIELNLFEAIALRDATSVADVPQQVLDRAPDMAEFVPGSLLPIQQTETGSGLAGLDAVEGLIAFSDVLQAQQADFAPGSTFTVAITDGDFVFNSDRVFELRTGGSGEVRVFENGVQTGTTDFQEFEAVRTISGTGRADASGGQGRDTLDLSVISDTLSPIPGSIGVLYNLSANNYDTDGGTARQLEREDIDGGMLPTLPPQTFLAGQIRYSSDDQIVADRAQGGDFEQVYGLRVDGVENVTTGNGNDIVIVDEGHSNKDNVFMMGAGSDRVIYFEQYGDGVPVGGNGNSQVDETTDFRVIVGAFAADPAITHFVEQTVGNNGQTEATDTLMGVQAITLDGQSARSIREADFIDLMNLNGGVVNYLDGSGTHPYDDQPAFPFAPESVYDAAGNFLLTIENINELENVDGSAGNDTVLVADASVMANSTTSPRNDIILGIDQDSVLPTLTWIEFDEPLAQRDIFNNVGQFTFDLMGGSDLVDYSDAGDNISLAVTRGTNVPQFVIVDASGMATFDRDAFVMTGSTNDRVDQLDSVEQVIASQGDSILDLTGLQLLAGEQNFQIVYGGVNPALNNNAIDRQGYDVNVNVGQANGASTNVRTYGEYRDLSAATSFTDTQLGSTTVDEVTAAWNRIEGGNNDERVLVGGDGSEAVVARLAEDMSFNLRGSRVTGTIGQGNSVQYGGYDLQAGGVTVTLDNTTAFDPTAMGPTGFFELSATFRDLDGVAIPGSMHMITGNTQDNQDAAGQLLIEGAVSGNDIISLTNLLDGSTVVVGATGVGGSGEIRVIQAGTPDDDGNPVDNIVVFTGFEQLMDDGTSNNAYVFANLATAALTLDLLDAAGVNDHDAIVVNNSVFDGAGMGFNGAGLDTIDLALINTATGGFNFDFDVLDVTGVTRPNLTLIGTSAGDPPQYDALLPVLGLFPMGDGMTDELVVGDLALIDNFSEFESLVVTEATVANGNTIVVDIDNGQVLQGSTTVGFTGPLLAFSATGLIGETFPIGSSYVPTVNAAINVSVIDTGAAGILLAGGNGDDSLSGGGGDDIIFGGAGADALDGGIQSEVVSYTLDLGTIIVDGEGVFLGGVDLGFDVGDIVLGSEVLDGPAGAIEVARVSINEAIVRLWNSGAAVFNNVAFDDVIDIETDNNGQSLIVTFDPAAGDQAGAGLAPGLVVNDNSDAGTVVAAFADGEDTFAYTDAGESTADSTDVISNFSINDGVVLVDDTLDFSVLSTLTGLAGGTVTSTATEFANLQAFFAAADAAFTGGGVDIDVFAGSDGTNGFAAVDADGDGLWNADNDMVIVLAGFDGAGIANFDIDNVNFTP